MIEKQSIYDRQNSGRLTIFSNIKSSIASTIFNEDTNPFINLESEIKIRQSHFLGSQDNEFPGAYRDLHSSSIKFSDEFSYVSRRSEEVER